MRVEGADSQVPSIRRQDLPKGWQNQMEVTRELGTKWLERGESALLRVPCAIVPETTNFLFNPLHEGAVSFRIVEAFTYPFDVRLKE